jgi:hypothetical protein
MVTCWTHKQKISEVIEGIPYCPGCTPLIIEKQNMILNMSKDELLDYSTTIGLTNQVKYSMTIDDIQIVILDKLKLLI